MVEQRKRILFVSHGHPDYVSGGGEIAAHNLHKKIEASNRFESVFFARHDKPQILHGGTAFSGTGKDNEILFYSSMPDWFKFSQPDKSKIWRDFREAVKLVNPDIVHFHHYVHLGLEMIREVKNINPDIKIVMTLHEYFGICHNHGQMVKPADQSLCEKSSPKDCSACFEDYSPQDFFLREQFIKSFFAQVDRFVSPSHFLAQRYIEWGICESKIEIIENVLRDSDVSEKTKITPELSKYSKIRIGYFGQVNWFKGLDVLLEAVRSVPEALKNEFILEINGSGLDKMDVSLQNKINKQIKEMESFVVLRGAYKQNQLNNLMAETDWLVVPSKWWENSPMVILEARKNGLPVICSNIGGMAEKVEHGRTGLHFKARNSASLAEQIVYVLENPDCRERYSKRFQDSYDAEGSMQAHIDLYDTLFESSEKTLSSDYLSKVA